jgi:hypothetical protein
MKSRFIILSVLFLIGINLLAQEISFEQLEYDFGTIPEESNSVSYEFNFKNTGKENLLLTKVHASCGCTTPRWTKEPIAPKKQGTIKVTYSTNLRPGYFDKTITVQSNAGEKVLTIKGIVTPRGQAVEKTYPFDFGGVRLQEKKIDFRTVKKEQQKAIKFGVFNSLAEEVTLKFAKLPKYLKVKSVTLASGEKGNIEILLNPAKMKSKEINDEIKVHFKQKGKEKTEIILKIHAQISEPQKAPNKIEGEQL